MENVVMDQVVGYGVFAVLFFYLFFTTQKDTAKREERYVEREQRYVEREQKYINQLTESNKREDKLVDLQMMSQENNKEVSKSLGEISTTLMFQGKCINEISTKVDRLEVSARKVM